MAFEYNGKQFPSEMMIDYLKNTYFRNVADFYNEFSMELIDLTLLEVEEVYEECIKRIEDE